MKQKSPKWLEDIRASAAFILQASAAKPLQEYQSDPLLPRLMKRNKSSISKASSYKAVGEYWDSHDLSKEWSKTKKVDFDVKIETKAIYYSKAG
jgi:hypothetical protein